MNDSHHTPEWVKDAVFYQVFPDRFARSGRLPKASHLEPWAGPPSVHGYKGGDLLGVCERLDYLSDLGVNALYLTPIFQSASNHRYHTHDYYRVDPMLGGDAAFRALLDEAHRRGLRVVIDGVFNHASRGFLQFSDILENGPHSAYVDWFNVRSFPLNAYGEGDLGYDAWWNLPALPKFNVRTPAVREFLLGVGEHWLRFGADGWRLDVPSEIDDDDFWREFRARCRRVNPEAYSVGEIWDDARRWLAGDMFDGVMNYPLTRAIFGLVGRKLAEREMGKSGLGHVERLSPDGFAGAVTGLLERYRPEAVMGQLNLLGSHDTPRLATSLCGDASAVRLAYLLMFVLPGAPSIYYGDEIGLVGGHDPHNRATMPWDEPETWNGELREHLKRLIELRQRRPELRRGTTEVTALGDRLVLVTRRLADDGAAATLVIVNVSGHDTRTPAGALPAGRYRDQLTGRLVALAAGDAGGDTVCVPGRGAVVLAPA